MERIREAVHVLDERKVDFEYDGEMQANVALDFELMRQLYPFCRLTGPANVLMMPALHQRRHRRPSCCRSWAAARSIGPILLGLANAGADRPDRRHGDRRS